MALVPPTRPSRPRPTSRASWGSELHIVTAVRASSPGMGSAAGAPLVDSGVGQALADEAAKSVGEEAIKQHGEGLKVESHSAQGNVDDVILGAAVDVGGGPDRRRQQGHAGRSPVSRQRAQLGGPRRPLRGADRQDGLKGPGARSNRRRGPDLHRGVGAAGERQVDAGARPGRHVGAPAPVEGHHQGGHHGITVRGRRRGLAPRRVSAAMDVLFALAAASPTGGVLEANFHRSSARQSIGKLPGRSVEVFCRCPGRWPGPATGRAPAGAPRPLRRRPHRRRVVAPRGGRADRGRVVRG